MEHFKTKTGLELPLMNLKGKPYLQVAHRVQWWRSEHPDWTVKTEIISTNERMTIARAEIMDEKGRLICDGFKQETAQHFSDHLEKAITGAIGRALALCGYGTQFAEELDEMNGKDGHRVVDSPIQPGKKTSNATPNVAPPLSQNNSFQGILKAANDYKWGIEEHVKPFMKLRYGKDLSKDLTHEQVTEFIKIIHSCTYDHAVEVTMGMDVKV